MSFTGNGNKMRSVLSPDINRALQEILQEETPRPVFDSLASQGFRLAK